MSSLDQRISSLEQQVSNLLALTAQQSARIRYLENELAGRDEQIVTLLEKLEASQAEVRKLKKLPGKPKVQASNLDKSPKTDEARDKAEKEGKRPGSEKSKKKENLEIHEHRVIPAKGVPEGWSFKGYEAYVVQDLMIRPNNIRYDREVWVSADGTERLVASLPSHLQGKHFGESLEAYILHQYYYCAVSQPLIHRALADYGVTISSGQINNILTLNRENFHSEKLSLLDKAIELKEELRTDDTSARHMFKSGFCNCINSDLFTYFTTSYSKSRINFLKILRREQTNYVINDITLDYASAHGLNPKYYTLLEDTLAKNKGFFADDLALEDFFAANGVKANYAILSITEALLIGALIHNGLDANTLIHSDGARQFIILIHSLCWKHAERPLLKLCPYNEEQQQALDAKLAAYWSLYRGLKEYKKQPSALQAANLTQRFQELCEPVTNFDGLNKVLDGLKAKQQELLLVLQYPQASIQNNASERDIREYVKRRKISAGTRSEQGRRARDTFLSLKKTSQKLGVSFWAYLIDRITNAQQIQPLSLIMQQKHISAVG